MADDFYIRKIKNNDDTFLNPTWFKKGDYLYGVISEGGFFKIIKTDLDSKFIWGKTFSFDEDRIDLGLTDYYYITDVAVTSEGDTIFSGYLGRGYEQVRGVLIKILANGDLIWCKEVPDNSTYSAFQRIKSLENNRLVILSDSPQLYHETNLLLFIDNDGVHLSNFNSPDYGYRSEYNILATSEDFVVMARPTKGVFIVDKIVNDGIGIEIIIYNIRNEVKTKYYLEKTLGDNRSFDLEEISVQLIENNLFVYGIETNTKNLIRLKVDLINVTKIIEVDSWDFNWITEPEFTYFQTTISDEALYVFYRLSPTTITKIYKFDHVEGFQWAKEVPRGIEDLISSGKEIFTWFVNTPGDDSPAFCKLNSDFNAGDCLDIKELFIDISKSQFTITSFLIEDLYRERNFEFRNIPFVSTSIINYEVEDICIVTSFVDLSQSTITTNSKSIIANGSSQAVITVQLKDTDGENITSGGETIVIATTKGTISATTDNNDGTYIATLTATALEEIATLSFTINGETATATTTVEFYIFEEDEFYIRKIQNKYVDLLEPTWVRIKEYIYVIINDPSAVRIIKTDLNLKCIWGQTFNFADDRVEQNLPSFFELNDVVETSDGNLLFCGYTGSGYESERGVLLKLTINGEMIWFKEDKSLRPGSKFIKLSNLSSDKIVIQDSFVQYAINGIHYFFLVIDNNGEEIDTFVGGVRNGSNPGSFTVVGDKFVFVDTTKYQNESGAYLDHLNLVIYNGVTKNVFRHYYWKLNGNDRNLSIEEIKVQLINDIIYVTGINEVTQKFIELKIDAFNYELIGDVNEYDILGDDSTSIIYTSGINNEFLYVFYSNTSTTTIVYKYIPSEGLIWKKEIPKNIKELVSTDDFILTPFKNAIGDDSDALCKMNHDFVAGSCLLIKSYGLSAISQIDIQKTIVPNDSINYNIYDSISFDDTPLIVVPITDYEVDDICVIKILPNLNLSTIIASPTSIAANGESTSSITVTLLDGNGNPYTNSAEVVIITNAGELSTVSLEDDGTYIATLTATDKEEIASLSFNVNGVVATAIATVEFVGVADLNNSTITANPTTITANGTSTSEISVQLKNAAGENIISKGAVVNIINTKGTITETIFDAETGTYKAILTSSKIHELAKLSFTVNDEEAKQNAIVRFLGILEPIVPCEHSFAKKIHLGNLQEGNVNSDEERLPEDLLSNIIRVHTHEEYTYILTSNYFLKLDAEGEVVWNKSAYFFIDGDTTNVARFDEFEIAPNGDLIVIVRSNNSTSILNVTRLNPEASLIWMKQYNADLHRGQSNSIHNLGEGNFVIIGYRNILLIDNNGGLLKSVTNDFEDIEVDSSIDYLAIIRLNIGSEIIVFDTDLDVIYSRKLTSNFTHVNQNILISGDDIIVSSSVINDSETTFVKFSLLEKQTTVTAKKFVGFNNSSNYKISYESDKLRGNRDFIYAYGKLDNYPVLYKLDTDFNIIWAKQIKQSIAKSIVGDVSGFSVNEGCLTFTLQQFDYSSKENVESGWLIHSDLDLNVEIGYCVKIIDVDIDVPVTSLSVGIEEVVFSVLEADIEAQVMGNQEFSVSNGVAKPLCSLMPKIKYTQSPYLRLQAAGSTGNDGSAKGVHLRWLFMHELGESHLPKGNLTSSTSGFNKPDDFVKISKVPYVKTQYTLDFNESPFFISSSTLSGTPFWIYDIDGNRYYVYFNNKSLYNSLRRVATIKPEDNPIGFLKAYGNNVIEVQTTYSLAFSVELITEGSLPSSYVQTELIGSEDKLYKNNKGIIARKTFQSNELSNTYQLVENIKTIRLRAFNSCIVSGLKFELYSTIVKQANDEDLWQEIGDYALTNEDEKAYSYLEPESGLVHNKWPRFNGGDFVNIENYKHKWSNDDNEEFNKDIKQIVNDYIRLSNDATNPKGIEKISFGDTDDEPIDVSHVDMLNIASMDYHVARMLGMGHLDLEPQTADQKFMYAIKYTTLKKMSEYKYDDDNYEVEHIYTSLPTSITDERLPLAYEVSKVLPGVPSGGSSTEQLDEEGNVVNVPSLTLADKNGFNATNKSRFVSIYAKEDEKDEELTSNFYAKTKQFNSSEYTEPVNGGIEYKLSETKGWKIGDSAWGNPELSITQDYFNSITTIGENPTPEIVPLSIPETNDPIFIHKQTQDGYYNYGMYGINLFGRVSPVTRSIEIETFFIPENNLTPPHNINALHIVEERPLLLTSVDEQLLLKAIPESKLDKTLVRLSFEYGSIQELISYKVTDRLLLEANENLKDKLTPGKDVLLHPESIFKDDKEVFADKIDIFFRNDTPRNIRGKIISITDHPTNEKISVVRTGNYRVNSLTDTSNPDNEIVYFTPEFPLGTSSQNFKGGVFTNDGNNFFIESITDAPTGVIINVYKNDVDNNVQTSIIPKDNVEVEGPFLKGDNLFMALENMISPNAWGDNALSTFEIQIGSGDNSNIHREIIINKNGPDDGEEKIVQKTRGFWGNTKISPIEQVVDKTTEVVDGEIITTDVLKHKGLYKIEFDFELAAHPQNIPNSSGNYVEWYGGEVRIHTQNDITGPRKNLKVIRIENVGSTSANLVVYALDDAFESVSFDDDGNEVPKETIITGNDVEVNFYPGYRVYLYADSRIGLTETGITPENEDIKYSVFGLRSNDSKGYEYTSPLSPPALMFVHKIIDPKRPEKPIGADYATRPDSFGKATYTLTSEFKHKPYGVMYFRSNDRQILSALYTDATVNEIIEKLESFAPDVFYGNRWDDLLSFNYEYGGDNNIDENHTFSLWPKTGNSYRFPKPNGTSFFDLINDEIKEYNERYNKRLRTFNEANFDLNTLVIPEIPAFLDNIPAKTVAYFVKFAILNSFTNLTEGPLLYNHIRTQSYQPIAKKQVLRDKNGDLLSPGKAPYDNSPMAKRIDDPKKSYDKILFTDFNLDGTSKNTYFYTSREVGSTTQLGEYSEIAGPIKLVNTKEPEAPEIKRVLPLLATNEFEFNKLPLEFVDVENIQIDNTNSLRKTSSVVWNAGAASKQILRGNSYVTFRVNEACSCMLGFSSFNTNSLYKTIQYALNIKDNGDLHIYESGEDLGKVGTYTIDTVFKIEVKGNRIIFTRDEVTLHEAFLLKVSEFILDISLEKLNSNIYDIELYTKAPTYTKEEIIGTKVPLNFVLQENIKITDNIISQQAGVGPEEWSAGAYSLEYMSYYGILSYKVKRNTNVIVGLANEENQDSSENIDYGIQTNSDGYLYIIINGKSTEDPCVQYDENSLLEIERRNNYLIFKKNQRPFYELPLENNIPLLVDFSMFTNNSEIIDLEMKSTNQLVKNLPLDTVSPSLSFEINAYQPDQRIRRLNLYRTQYPENTLTVRTMDLVNSIDIVLSGQADQNIWSIKDEFLGLDFVPYSDPLYYKVTVSREIEFAKAKRAAGEKNTLLSEYKPSKSSKLLVSSIVESTSPQGPDLTYSFDILENNDTVIDNIILKWKKTVHNGKYHIYNMNTQGNWVKIHEVISNDDEIQLFLDDTDLENALQIQDGEGNLKYHHFKIDAENSIGMLNVKSKIVTIPGEAGVASLEGIGSMIIEHTNLVR